MHMNESRHDSLTCNMTHSYEWDSLTCIWISHDMTHWHVTWLIHMNVTCEKVTTDKVFGELWIMRGLFAAKVSCLHMSPVAINKPYYLRTCHFTWVFGWLTHVCHDSRIWNMTHSCVTWEHIISHEYLELNIVVYTWMSPVAINTPCYVRAYPCESPHVPWRN